MKIYIICATLGLLFTSIKTVKIRNKSDTWITLGRPAVHSIKESNHAKRDLSLSYTATNIDSKEGTRVKTITVIKNQDGKTYENLSINPDLHKGEDWAKAFRDNFDSYSTIPDVPDIDDLFEFMNKKKPLETDAAKMMYQKTVTESKSLLPNIKPTEEQYEDTTIIVPSPKVDNVQKIEGDAELISSSSKRQNNILSQSFSFSKSRGDTTLTNNDTIPLQNSRRFEKYINNNNPKPCNANPISITTPSGRTYDYPVKALNIMKPYLAPAIAKKVQIESSESLQRRPMATARTTYSVNSILPPLQSTPVTFVKTALELSTSQRPYVASNNQNDVLKKPSSYHVNIFGSSFNRPNTSRSRGLKY